MHNLLAMLEGFERELDDMERRVARRTEKQVTGRGPSNLVTVTMAGNGQVTGVNVDARYAERTHDRAIADELRAAFAAAYARSGDPNPRSLLGDGDLGALYELAGDPTALLRRLGLGRR